MISKKRMPGGMRNDESPPKGELPLPDTRKTKPSFRLEPGLPPEPMTDEALAEKYGAGVGTGRTRSQRKESEVKPPMQPRTPKIGTVGLGQASLGSSSEDKRRVPSIAKSKSDGTDGLDRLDSKSSDRLDSLKGPITHVKVEDDCYKYLDRPGPKGPGGDRYKEGLDPPGDPGGDQPGEERVEPPNPDGSSITETVTGKPIETKQIITSENSTVNINSSDASSQEIEKMLSGSPVIEDPPNSAGDPGGYTTATGGTETQHRDDLDERTRHLDEMAKRSEERMRIWHEERDRLERLTSPPYLDDDGEGYDVTPKKSDRGRSAKGLRRYPTRDFLAAEHIMEEKEMEYGSESEDSMGPPLWRDVAKTPAYVVQRKMDGTGDWSERDARTLRRLTRKLHNSIGLPAIATLEEVISGSRDHKLQISMPPEPPNWSNPFKPREKEESILLAAVRTNDYGDDDETEKRSRRHQKRSDHEEVMGTLSAYNTTHRLDRPANKPMSEVRLNYGRNALVPKALNGSTAMGMVRDRATREAKGKGREGNNERSAPSISNARTNVPDSSRTVYNKHGGDDGSDHPPRKPRIIPPVQDKIRDSSERRKYRRNSSGSSSDGSDSGSDGPNGPRPPKKSKKKRRRHHSESDDSDRYDRGLKMKLPESYDGKADIEAFDAWVFSITNYADVMRIREGTMIKMMMEFMTGKPRTFYTNCVVGRTTEWSYETIFTAIFDYCFPQDAMRKLRARWHNLTQGKRRVREYVREIEVLARRLPELNERAVVLKFWDGLNSDIREIARIKDAEPEIDDLNEIIRKAQEAEVSREERNIERNTDRNNRTEGDKRQPKREWTRFKNRTGGNKNFKPGDREEKQAPNKSDKIRMNAVNTQNAPEQKTQTGFPAKETIQNETGRAQGRG